MSYQVLARRFRPRTFEEVVGQDAILHSLRSSLLEDRVPHALLFAGSRGVGKTTLARILARCLNCETGITPDPCGKCHSCTSILDGSNSDVIEIDAASHNLVDDIRELRERVGFASMGSRYKVYILDEVHMLTRSAFNAFLKTLEEPPSGVVFILATTEIHKVPETIRSRCQQHLFQRVGEADIRKRLRAICDHEEVALPDEVLADVAASCRGGMRDAETALERALPVAKRAFEASEPFGVEEYRRLTRRVGLDRVVTVIEGMLTADAAQALRFVDEVVANGVDEREALGEVVETLRAMLLLHVDGKETGLVSVSGELRDRLVQLAQATEQPRIMAMIQAGLLGRERIRRLDDRRLVLELTLVRMAEAGDLPALGDLVAAVRDGAEVPAAVPAAATPDAPARPRAATPGTMAKRLLALARDERPLLVRTLEQCKFEEPDGEGSVVRIALQTTQRMHVDRMNSPDVQQQIANLLSQVLDRPVKVQLVRSASAKAATQSVQAAGKPAPTGAAEAETKASKPKAKKRRSKSEPSSSVKRVLDRFDGQILDADGDSKL